MFGKKTKVHVCCPGKFLLMNFITDLVILVGIFGKMTKVCCSSKFLLMTLNTYLVI